MGLVVAKQVPGTEPAQDMDILTLLEDAKIECQTSPNKYFIPRDHLENIVNIENVRRELKTLFPSLTATKLNQYIATIFHPSRTATGVFVTVLWTRKESILEVLDEGITDSDLTLERQYLRTHPGVFNRPFVLFCQRGHDQYRHCKDPKHVKCKVTTVKAMSEWTPRQIQEFDAIQWRVKSPVFEKLPDGEIPHYNIHPNIVMPYVEDHEYKDRLEAGGYGEVWPVVIHPAHQSVYKRGNLKNDCPRIAVKRLHSRVKAEFEQERKMLRYLTLKHHRHLVKLLATYKLKGQYHLLFPFADANLRRYWEDVRIPPRTIETYIWCLDQLTGLVSGLDIIHNFQTFEKEGVKLGSDTGNDGLSRIRPSGFTNFSLIVEDGEEIFGRHGDLKPENILWFNETENPDDRGILQITDLGLGRFHRIGSKSKDDPRKTGGSATYVPPEMALNKPISRAYDIWSLGCVFLEFVTWMVEGYPAVKAFSDARLAMTEDGVKDDTFFTRIGKRAEVRKGVISWVQRLRQHPRCSRMIHALLDLTMNRMLLIPIKDRINSTKLKTNLKDILERSERDTQPGTLEYVLGR